MYKFFGMKNTLLVLLLLTLFAQFSHAQKAIERKIIIEHFIIAQWIMIGN
jgi:hypothetical protein